MMRKFHGRNNLQHVKNFDSFNPAASLKIHIEQNDLVIKGARASVCQGTSPAMTVLHVTCETMPST